jgi:hypothetical protein
MNPSVKAVGSELGNSNNNASICSFIVKMAIREASLILVVLFEKRWV